MVPSFSHITFVPTDNLLAKPQFAPELHTINTGTLADTMIDITSPAPSTSLDHPQIEQLQNIMSDLWRDYRRDVETLQSKVAAVDLAYAGCPKPSDTSPSWFDGPRAAQLQQACHGSQYDLSHVELWAISAADAIAGGEGAESASQEAWDPLLAISTVEKDSRWVKAENEKEENRPALSNLYSALTEYYQAAETILPNARKRVLSTLAMPLGLTINPNRSDNSVKSTCDAIRSCK